MTDRGVRVTAKEPRDQPCATLAQCLLNQRIDDYRELAMIVHPAAYVRMCAVMARKYATSGPAGLTLHKHRKQAMRMTGRGNQYVSAPNGRILARAKQKPLGLHPTNISYDDLWDAKEELE